MKKITLLFLLNSLLIFSQNELEKKVNDLKVKINNEGESVNKLLLLDSLSRITNGKTEFKYDSIATVTIDYALELDSTRLALIHSAKLIDYLISNLGETELAIKTFNSLKPRFTKKRYYSELGKFYYEGASAYQLPSRYEEALKYFKETYGFALKAKDNKLMANAKESIGHVYSMMGNFQRAAVELQEAIQIYSRFNEKEVGHAKRNLAILYSQNGLQEEAKKLREEIIDIGKDTKSYKLVYLAFYDQAFDEMLHGSQKERLKYLDSAQAYSEQLRDLSLKELSIAQLGAYSENGLLNKAKQVKQQLEELLKGDKNPNLPEYNLSMAQYEFALGNYEQAAVLGEKEHENIKDSKFYEGIYMVNGFLSKVYYRLGDQNRAYEYLTVYSKIKDSIESVHKANGFSYYQMLYETEKLDFKIASQQSEIDILDEKNKVKQQWILFGGLGLLVLFSLVYLFRSRKYTKSKQVLQEQFSQDLINGQEKERTRLARELHDSVGQKLMLLSKQVKNTGDSNMVNLADITLEEIRNISRGLHPSNLERLGLTEAINALVYSINANTNLFFTDEIDDIDDVLSRESELHLYRIIQETLNNAVKHSEAKAVKMHVNKTSKGIRVVVSDNGKGFDFETKRKSISLGLKTLFERAKIIDAQMSFDSEINKGTKMSLMILT